MHRQVGRVIDQQASWAKPLGEGAQEFLKEVFDATRPLKDILNGTWLGHPVHPVVTDVPVGAMTVAAVLDVTGQDTAADLAVLTGLASMAASAATGAADAVDTYGKRRCTRPCTRRSWSRRSPPMGLDAAPARAARRAAIGAAPVVRGLRGDGRRRVRRWRPLSGTETRSTATRSTRNRRSGRRWT